MQRTVPAHFSSLLHGGPLCRPAVNESGRRPSALRARAQPAPLPFSCPRQDRLPSARRSPLAEKHLRQDRSLPSKVRAQILNFDTERADVPPAAGRSFAVRLQQVILRYPMNAALHHCAQISPLQKLEPECCARSSQAARRRA